ncbi:hypothetical protein BC629DRAFT_1549338 [Irpex lacteus]|nr:hypothetical protein BC629DRAFT_1549338 [Irpex lacteus]
MSSSSYLSSPLVSRTRSPSRPSSRASSNGRASPIVNLQDEQVAIRTQMSTLKHNIRHQQAQLHTLENSIRTGPRPYPPGTFSTTEYDIYDMDPSSPTAYSTSNGSTSATSPFKTAKRRSSFEVLSTLAGRESNLPLPKTIGRSPSFNGDEIREGIPITSPSKRQSSPTRTLSRIPVASVGNARALAEENDNLQASSSSLPPISPNKRSSFAPGNTTKVLADLQAGVLHAKNALENTRGQLRASQRQASMLTRQVEDLKEARERLRLENEGLNNVVARKERLLQEVLERARRAEAEALSLKSALKSETTISKKTIREIESSLAESTARTQKAEREYNTLRDSVKGLVDGFKQDHNSLREEMRKREERLRKEADEVKKKYLKLVEEVNKQRESEGSGMNEVKRLKEEAEEARRKVEEGLRVEIQKLREEVDRSAREDNGAVQTAKNLSDELARLRRLMRTSGQNGSISSIPVSVARAGTPLSPLKSPSTATAPSFP